MTRMAHSSARKAHQPNGPPTRRHSRAAIRHHGLSAAPSLDPPIVQKLSVHPASIIRHRLERGGVPQISMQGGQYVTSVSVEHEELIRKRAYFLWQGAGCPEGRAEEFWMQAVELEAAARHSREEE